jgi:hypothetical protein
VRHASTARCTGRLESRPIGHAVGRSDALSAISSRAMYSSLDKIDIVAQAPDGTRLFVQTDHRAPAEIDDEPELSVVFALSRILNPRRMESAAIVRYAAIGGVHPTIARVVASTGAVLEVAGEPVDLSDVERNAPEDLADAAFAGLGRRVLERHGLACDEAGLAAFERRIAGAPTAEEDEIGWWTAVVELAAVTGEVMRALHGGRWITDDNGYADLPFMFKSASGDLRSNVIDKARRFLVHGDGQSPRQLLRAMEDRGDDGPLLFSLKPASWAAGNDMVCEPLADVSKTGADVPMIVYGHDHPNTFAMLKRGEQAHDLAAMRAEALVNLAKIEVEVETVELEQITFHAVYGNYFASEKVLDEAFMHSLHARIGELLAVSLPEKGRLFVTSAAQPPDAIIAFMSIAQGVFQRNEGGRQLCPTVFLVSDAKIVGVAQPSTSEPDEPSDAASPWKKKGTPIA